MTRREQLATWCSLAAAIISLIVACSECYQHRQTRERVEDLEGMCNPASMFVTVQSLRDDAEVGARAILAGVAPQSRLCQNYFVLVGNETSTHWKVTDGNVVRRDGSWSGVADFAHIEPGTRATIRVLVTRDPMALVPGQDLGAVPAIPGIASDPVHVWRTR